VGSSIFNEVQLLKGKFRTMELLKPKIEDYPGQHIKLKIDNSDLDFAEAKDFATQKAEETGADPMLLSWYQGKTRESYPNLECGPGDKPAWIVYAESRGGDLTIDINEGQYVFIYLSI
jgi:Domain of unknown function (DUF5619)